jgi:pimeloyl-ACP methyl ester carboxylesterase
MTETDACFQVRSSDGTPIAVWVTGDGPPLVLVHGTFSDHTTYGPLIEALGAGVRTFAMDRRGRGGSGDAADHCIQREFDDVAVVVDAVAARVGRPVTLWGHSHGASCAMGAATLTGNVADLILYEPALGAADVQLEVLESAIADGDLELAAEAFLMDIVGMSADDVRLLRASPVWPSRLAVLPTVPREIRADSQWRYLPGQFVAISAPTIILSGSESPDDLKATTCLAARAILGARIHVLDGHAHMAHQTHPASIARLLRQVIDAGTAKGDHHVNH